MVMMPTQRASLEALGTRKKGNASPSGLMAEGRCVQPGCQGFGLAACMYHHMLCAVSVARRKKKNMLLILAG